MQFYNGRTFVSHFLKCETVKSATFKNSQMCDYVADMEIALFEGIQMSNVSANIADKKKFNMICSSIS